LYNAALHYRFGVPVHSVLVLLRPSADHPTVTGRLHYEGRRRRGKLDFSYEVVRVWRQSARSYLHGGLGTLPLAPLCRLPPGKPLVEALGPIIRRIDERLATEAAPADRAQLLAATFVLTGLRVPREGMGPLFERMKHMKESSGYQIILEEGRAEGLALGRTEGRVQTLQQTLLRLGRQQCGAPSKAVQAALQAISDADRLERMADQLLRARTWQELLAVK
jgi:predicted transposase YdaD